MEKTTITIPMERFGERWTAYTLTAAKDLGDGYSLVATISYGWDEGIRKIQYRTAVYKAKRGVLGSLHSHENLKQETFGNLLEAVRYCETVDLGEIETTNE